MERIDPFLRRHLREKRVRLVRAIFSQRTQQWLPLNLQGFWRGRARIGLDLNLALDALK